MRNPVRVAFGALVLIASLLVAPVLAAAPPGSGGVRGSGTACRAGAPPALPPGC